MNGLRDRIGRVEAWAGLPQNWAINDLAKSGTIARPAAFQDLSGVGVPLSGRATGDPPPRNRTAASTGIEGGGETEDKNAGKRLPDYYRTHPILSKHYGLGGDQ